MPNKNDKSATDQNRILIGVSVNSVEKLLKLADPANAAGVSVLSSNIAAAVAAEEDKVNMAGVCKTCS